MWLHMVWNRSLAASSSFKVEAEVCKREDLASVGMARATKELGISDSNTDNLWHFWKTEDLPICLTLGKGRLSQSSPANCPNSSLG